MTIEKDKSLKRSKETGTSLLKIIGETAINLFFGGAPVAQIAEIGVKHAKNYYKDRPEVHRTRLRRYFF